jgi:hypothetical protein
MRKRHTRAMAIYFFVIVISFFYLEIFSGTDCIRPVHVVTLLVCGMGIGVFLQNLFGFLRNKRS